MCDDGYERRERYVRVRKAEWESLQAKTITLQEMSVVWIEKDAWGVNSYFTPS